MHSITGTEFHMQIKNDECAENHIDPSSWHTEIQQLDPTAVQGLQHSGSGSVRCNLSAGACPISGNPSDRMRQGSCVTDRKTKDQLNDVVCQARDTED